MDPEKFFCYDAINRKEKICRHVPFDCSVLVYMYVITPDITRQAALHCKSSATIKGIKVCKQDTHIYSNAGDRHYSETSACVIKTFVYSGTERECFVYVYEHT